MQPRVSQYCITLTLARCGSIQTIVENWRLIADFGEGLGYWQFTPPVRIQIWFTVIQRSSFHHGNTEMTTFVEANLGGIHEKFVLLVSGCLGCRPFAFIFKRDVVLMLRSLLFQGACALNPSDDEYFKAAKTHSSNSSLSLGKNEPMCKFKYGGSSIIPPMTLILVYIK